MEMGGGRKLGAKARVAYRFPKRGMYLGFG